MLHIESPTLKMKILPQIEYSNGRLSSSFIVDCVAEGREWLCFILNV